MAYMTIYPKIQKSSFNSYTIGTYNIQRASRRPYNTFSAEDEYIDTEIGFQQIEGCKKNPCGANRC